jgi:hypothetical protein
VTSKLDQPADDNLSKQLDEEFAPAWRPEPGDKLIGEVTAVSERMGIHGLYPIVTIRRDNGEQLAAHAFHSKLRYRLADIQVKVGDRIGIKYLGKAKRDGTASGYQHVYKVVTSKPTAAVDWSKYRGDEDDADTAALPEPTAADRAAERFGDDPGW